MKGADLGRDDDALVIDLNFGYNPSCVYDPGWACPLAPAGNRLEADVPVGELTPVDPDPTAPADRTVPAGLDRAGSHQAGDPTDAQDRAGDEVQAEEVRDAGRPAGGDQSR